MGSCCVSDSENELNQNFLRAKTVIHSLEESSEQMVKKVNGVLGED